ncbi:LOG family protein [Micromonospora parva]|uniref:LOG family protein n=1 Tax=Micromonospora parva TaxID=1464048 RepID=UPI0004C08040|nr:LOG family protein [Micromonospora parva]
MAAICVFCASSRTLDQRWLDLAAETGAELARRGHTLVSGGGCVGMMGALADGARSAGGRTLGVIPQSLVDLEVADLASDELLVTDSMATRKTVMIDKSDDTDGFYRPLLDWLDALADQTFLKPAGRDLLTVTTTVTEALDILESHLT